MDSLIHRHAKILLKRSLQLQKSLSIVEWLRCWMRLELSRGQVRLSWFLSLNARALKTSIFYSKQCACCVLEKGRTSSDVLLSRRARLIVLFRRVWIGLLQYRACEEEIKIERIQVLHPKCVIRYEIGRQSKRLWWLRKESRGSTIAIRRNRGGLGGRYVMWYSIPWKFENTRPQPVVFRVLGYAGKIVELEV